MHLTYDFNLIKGCLKEIKLDKLETGFIKTLKEMHLRLFHWYLNMLV